MQTIVNVQTHRGQNMVSARELHTFLSVQTDFSDWCKRMFEYGFVENQDYSLLKIGEQKGSGGHNKTDYLFTLDTAKEIAMIQRTDKGREIRNYFIECERSLHLVGDVITEAQHKALDCQKESADLLNELERVKRENAPVFQRMAAIKRQLKALQNTTFNQLGLFNLSSIKN